MIRRRVYLALLFPWLVLDCIASVLAGESFHTTLSAKAHHTREKGHKVWGWTANAIDTAFFWQTNHCRIQWEREQHYGGVWSAFAADWRGEQMTPNRSAA